MQSSSVPLKTTLCRMLGLIGLVCSAEIHFTGYQFREMPTSLNISGESSYVATDVLANVSCPTDLCVSKSR